MRPHILIAALCCLFAAPAASSAQLVDDATRRNAMIHYRFGEERMRAEQFDKAAEEFTTAIKFDPLLTSAHYELGQAHMAVKRYPDAVRAYIACREAFRQIAALSLSNDVSTDRRRDEEIQELRDSLRRFRSGEIKTTSRETMIMRLEQRINDLERMKQRGPTSFETPSEVSMALGSAYFRSGALADAEREYKEAVKVNPKFGEAHNNLAVVYLMTERAESADEEIKLAEKSGFRVNPRLKEDVKKRRSARR